MFDVHRIAPPCLRILLTVWLCFACQSARPDEQPPNETSGEDKTSVSAAKSAPAPSRKSKGAFLSLDEFSEKYPGRDAWLPNESDRSPWVFVLLKLLAVILAVVFWCAVQRLRTEDEDDEELESEPWTRVLFASGLAGVLIALVVPPYAIGGVILVVSNVVPFWRYMRWRNQQAVSPTAPLMWKHLWTRRVIARKAKHVSEVKLPSGESIGTSGAVIQLIERTPGQPQTSKAAQHSQGFQIVMALIDHAAANRVTDLHINSKDDGVVVRQRVDGSLKTLTTLPQQIGHSAINVIKVFGNLNIADHRRSQDGSFRADVDGQRLSFRVSSQGIHAGEKLSIRVLDPAKNFASLATLGMSEAIQQRFAEALNRPNGVVLFVGATGAGKSTTACASLQTVAADDRSVISIEDPIEYQIPSIDQIEINERAGQTFESALRAVLRQDADVIFIGEMRDDQTAKTGCRAALTGQLVLGTMHANDAAAGVVRMVELGVNREDVASTLRVVLAQTLVRKLCTDCRIPYRPEADVLKRLHLTDFEGELYKSPDPATNTCATCNGRGFFRRTAVFELLQVTPDIRDLIRNQAAVSEIEAAARKHGMSTIWNEGLRLVREGVISVAELDRVSDED